jgi:hypothetical protein
MAKLKTTTPRQWRILLEILDERGVILISPEMSRRMVKQNLIAADQPNEIDYNFGGECDVMVDFITSESSYAYRAALKQLAEDEGIGETKVEAGST